MHLHPSYFNRAFKSVYGMSALQMLKKIRLRRATAMLEETDFTLDAIAEGCGFSDAAYFSRIFRRHMGQTPGDYRRSVANAKIRFIKES